MDNCGLRAYRERMSNSGTGAFIRELHVSVPLAWVLAVIEHLEAGDEKAQAAAEKLSGCLPRAAMAHLMAEGEEAVDDVAEEPSK